MSTNDETSRPWHRAYGSELPKDLPPLRYASVAHLARETTLRYQKRKAFSCVVPNGMNGTLTYEQVDTLSDAFAAFLIQTCKLAPGARVAIQLPNGLPYPIVTLGTFKAGCVLVNTNPLYTANEMVHQFRDSGADVLVLVDMVADKLARVIPQTGIKQVVLAGVSELFPTIPNWVVRTVQKVWNRTLPPVPRLEVPVVRFANALADGTQALAAEPGLVEQRWQTLTPNSLALLQYTGGTTGVAKAAMLSHGNLLANIDQIQLMARQKYSDEDCVLTALPLYHIFAFTANMLSFYDRGAWNILVPSPRPVQNIQRALENYPINWVSGVNTLFNGLMNEEWFTAYPPRHLTAAIAGGTSLHKSVARRWQTITGTQIAEGYGLTETSPLVSFNPFGQGEQAEGIGIPVPGTDVFLVDDDGAPVAQGEPGELIVKGPQVMSGYWQKPDETEKVLQSGWFFTGDVAVMDEHGFLRIVDRKKDMILVSGFNVYPNEVEDALTKMDAILEAAVVGIPNKKSGEAPRAYVVPNPDYDGDLDETEIRAHCKSLLTDYKRPKEIRIVDELPKSPVGKILRKDLKAQVKAEFAMKASAATEARSQESV